jgi:AGCS family alanine or glycine:cation symporter
MASLMYFAFTCPYWAGIIIPSVFGVFFKRNMKAVKIFAGAIMAAEFVGPYMTASAVWTIAEKFNGLWLSRTSLHSSPCPRCGKETNDYFRNRNNSALKLVIEVRKRDSRYFLPNIPLKSCIFRRDCL